MKPVDPTTRPAEAFDCVAPELTSPLLVVHDGPHRLLGTSSLPSAPFAVESPSYEPPASTPLLPSVQPPIGVK